MPCLRADARSIPLRDSCVQTCVTSPPYFGLRDYQTARWEGGNAECEHKVRENPRTEVSGLSGGKGTTGHQREGFKGECPRCGARRIDAQIGLEATPDEYVATLVAVFRAVRRVLRDDGTCWLNLGSSYYSDAGKGGSGTFNGRNGRGEQYGRASKQSAPPCDTSDRARSDSRSSDSTSSHLCDGCRAVLPADCISRNGHSPAPKQEPSSFESNREHRESSPDHLPTLDCARPEVRTIAANLDPLLSQDLAGEPLLASQVSTLLQSSSLRRGDCRHCDNCGACLSVLGSSSRDARLCARRAGYTRGKDEPEQIWRSRMTDMVLASEAWGYLTTESLKAKDDVAIPSLVALALRMDGWYLRSDIVWAKPNPMPESVTDRPTRSHEYIFLLSKSERYFYDADAIRETAQAPPVERPHSGSMRSSDLETYGLTRGKSNPSCSNPNGRNKRDVWTVNSEPISDAHFATFPRKLIEPCILAGTSERGCCSECGAPWVRVTENTPMVIARSTRTHPLGRTRASGTMLQPPKSVTTGWQPSCSHDAPTVPCLVLDPFIGSGTTGIVAEKFGRRWVGLDLSDDYIAIAQKRTAQTGLRFGATR